MEKMKAIHFTRYGLPEVLIRIMTVAITASECIVKGFKLPAVSWIMNNL